jgi:NADPH:quinone reductase-like Zn-dependent oxidoreductase
MPSNAAAWFTAKAQPLEIKPAPYPTPRENQIVIKNGAFAINPVDWGLRDMGRDLFPWITIPSILGQDISGEVTEVGSAVTRFKVGDRVLGHAVGLKTNDPAEGAFQHYSVVQENMASPIPATLSYEQASVLPLCLSTAACGLFQKDYLNLPHPTVPARKPTGEYLLITGGASSVGCNAIQLAVAAGYEVITTSSPKNFDLVKSLGASQAFDYNDPKHTSQIIEALKGKTIAGAVSISKGSFRSCLDVVEKSEGGKFIAMGLPEKDPVPDGIGSKFIFGSDLKDNEVGNAIYRDFLPQALVEGTFKVAPDAQVVGKGLEFTEEALEVHKKGVSAAKVVVSL